MALNMTESDAVSRLLRFIAGGGSTTITGEVTLVEAQTSAEALLSAAEKRLMMRPVDHDQLRAALENIHTTRKERA